MSFPLDYFPYVEKGNGKKKLLGEGNLNDFRTKTKQLIAFKNCSLLIEGRVEIYFLY